MHYLTRNIITYIRANANTFSDKFQENSKNILCDVCFWCEVRNYAYGIFEIGE